MERLLRIVHWILFHNLCQRSPNWWKEFVAHVLNVPCLHFCRHRESKTWRRQEWRRGTHERARHNEHALLTG